MSHGNWVQRITKKTRIVLVGFLALLMTCPGLCYADSDTVSNSSDDSTFFPIVAGIVGAGVIGSAILIASNHGGSSSSSNSNTKPGPGNVVLQVPASAVLVPDVTAAIPVKNTSTSTSATGVQLFFLS